MCSEQPVVQLSLQLTTASHTNKHVSCFHAAEPGQELEGQEHQVQEQQQKGSTEEGGSEAPSKDGIAGWFSKLSKAINDNDPHSAVDQDVNVYSIHDNAEQFEEKTEAIFRYLQVLVVAWMPLR